MLLGVEVRVEWPGLEEGEKPFDDKENQTKEHGRVDGPLEGTFWGEAEVEEQEGLLEDKVDEHVEDFFDKEELTVNRDRLFGGCTLLMLARIPGGALSGGLTVRWIKLQPETYSPHPYEEKHIG